MARKTYYANVEVSTVDYFEEKLREREDVVNVITKDEFPKTSGDGTQYIRYLLEAEEGVIDPKWELQQEEI